MKFARNLFEHYKSYHLHGPLMLTYAGILGAIGFPAFYLLRFAKASAPYDDIVIRGAAAFLCLLLLLKNHWPERLKPYYLAYSYPALVFSLPVHFVFTSLMNGGGSVAVANTLMAAFFVILVTDWRNTIAMLVLGFGAAVLLYLAVDPAPEFPTDYLARLPVMLLVVIGGSLFKAAGNQAAAEKMRQAYASIAGTIAHEMRNPLGQLKHDLEGIERALPLPAAAAADQVVTARQLNELYRHLGQGELAVERGLQVISMTLDEVHAKPVDVSAFSLLSAVQATDKAVQEYAFETDSDRRKVSVQVVDDFSFRGDETAYVFVLFNLIKNGMYYLAPHPDARMTITVERQRVLVRDSGPGIPAAELTWVFEPFRSVGKVGGTGLGLAYCQRVMRAFGGRIDCESTLGEFTQFTLSFPPISEQESQAQMVAAWETGRAAFRGRRLLIVDDDPIQRMTTRHKLQPLDAVIDEAEDGQRALDLVCANRYDLILLDLNMPVLDGYAVTEQIRRGHAPLNRDVRIVAYTSEPVHLASIKTHKVGMDGFVSKPCGQLRLVHALHQAMERPVARAQLGGAVLGGRRILLADDNPYNRKAVAAYLKHAGAAVGEAGNGQDVLQFLRVSGEWDAILMDINMPGMDGLETAQAIRAADAQWRDIPIVALTAYSDQVTVHAARAAGMDDFITKPVDAPVLYAMLGQLVSGRRMATAPQPAQPEAAGGKLLNFDRLESYRRIGMLEELLSDFLPEIARLVDKLEESAGRRDLAESLDVLHSLLGTSGEAGALALYKLVRRVYVPMVEDQGWPATDGWLGQIKALAAQTEEGLKAFGAAKLPAQAG